MIPARSRVWSGARSLTSSSTPPLTPPSMRRRTTSEAAFRGQCRGGRRHRRGGAQHRGLRRSRLHRLRLRRQRRGSVRRDRCDRARCRSMARASGQGGRASAERRGPYDPAHELGLCRPRQELPSRHPQPRRSRVSLDVVSDEIGAATSALLIADATIAALRRVTANRATWRPLPSRRGRSGKPLRPCPVHRREARAAGAELALSQCHASYSRSRLRGKGETTAELAARRHAVSNDLRVFLPDSGRRASAS